MANYVNWTGRSGQMYKTERYPIGTAFNPVPGVYISCKLITDQRLIALYVGETNSFQRRLNEEFQSHDGLRCSVRNGATHLCTLVVSDPERRLNIETDLRHGLQPACNKEAVPRLTNALFVGR